MKRIITAGALMVLAFSAHAQFAGAGAQAGAISGSGAESASGAAAILNQTTTTPAHQTIDQNINTSGTTTLKNVPQVYAPSIGTSAPCRYAVSLGGAVAGFGIAGGAAVNDEECQLREDVRVLAQMGEAVGAMSLMCAKESVRAAMPTKCAEVQKASGVGQPTPTPTAAPAKKADVTAPQASNKYDPKLLPSRERTAQGWPVPEEVVAARPAHGRMVADTNGYLWTRLELKDGTSEWHVAQAPR